MAQGEKADGLTITRDNEAMTPGAGPRGHRPASHQTPLLRYV